MVLKKQISYSGNSKLTRALIGCLKACYFLLIFLSLASCNEYFGFTVDCDECFSIKPDSADLIIDLTINAKYDSVPIVVYKGLVEDNNIEWIDTAGFTPYYLYVPVNEKYSVTAKYKTGDNTIIVVDGDKLKIKHVSESCDVECWVITGGIIDVELEFDD